jgi:hypothetical protein
MAAVQQQSCRQQSSNPDSHVPDYFVETKEQNHLEKEWAVELMFQDHLKLGSSKWTALDWHRPKPARKMIMCRDDYAIGTTWPNLIPLYSSLVLWYFAPVNKIMNDAKTVD